MKTKQNTKTKTLILGSIILGLSAVSSYAKPNNNNDRHRSQPTKQAYQKASGHQHYGYTRQLPSNRRTVRFGNILYYIVGDLFYTNSSRGYKAVAKPRGYTHHRYTPQPSNKHHSHYSRGRGNNRR